MKSLKIILDKHPAGREDAVGFIQAAAAAAESSSFAGYDVVVDAGACEIMDDDFTDAFIRLLLGRMGAESLDITGGYPEIVKEFSLAAAAQDLQHKLRVNGAPAWVPVQRTVSTEVFAHSLGEKIADQRSRQPITGVFAAELVRYGVPAADGQRAAMANEVSRTVLADTRYDDETSMARRAVVKVLTRHYGETITVDGPWIRNETVTVDGKVHRLSGRPCPNCAVSPECLGNYQLSNYCTSCGWFNTPF